MNTIFDSRKTLRELNLTGSLVEIDDDKRKQIQGALFDMYLDIKTVCDKYGIVPYLIGGSCLGAIRHEGFIPWDDDIDIGMTRNDYNRFIKIFEEDLSSKYIINAPNNRCVTKARFPKIYKRGTLYREIGDNPQNQYNGLFLDIFVIENVPRNKFVRFFRGSYCNLIEFISGQVLLFQNNSDELRRIYNNGKNMVYRIKYLIGRVFSYRSASYWFNKVDNVANYKKYTGIYGIVTGRKHYFGEIFEEGVFFPKRDATFNNVTVSIFNNYDLYLRNLYGDYMKIPQIDKRERHYIVELDLGEENKTGEII